MAIAAIARDGFVFQTWNFLPRVRHRENAAMVYGGRSATSLNRSRRPLNHDSLSLSLSSWFSQNRTGQIEQRNELDKTK